MAEQPDTETDLPEDAPQTTQHEALASREIAFSLLGQVLQQKRALDSLLDSDKAFLELPTRDKAFVRMIVATTLRRAGQLDDMIRRGSNRNEMPSPPQLHTLLRMAAAQIAFMNVPDYAVVDTAVRLAEAHGMGRQKGFVNAVLRRITENHREWVSKQDAGRLNTPEWLMKLWIDEYGLKTAAEIAEANLSEAPLDMSLKDPKEMQHWADTLDASILPTGSLRLTSGGAVQNLQGFDDGMWWVQDAAASLPAQLLGDVSGARVLDLCAAPGGKTAQLLTLGAEVTAVDRSVARLKRLHDNLARLRLTDHITVESADASVWKPKEPFDFILLDAPCTATGTARRHPDVMHLKAPNDLTSLVDIQQRLIDNAVDMLAPNGVLIYCTCSLQKKEGEEQIARLLSKHKSMRRLPISPVDVGGMDAIVTPEGDVRVLPFHMAAHGGMDGFFIARLQKTSTISN